MPQNIEQARQAKVREAGEKGEGNQEDKKQEEKRRLKVLTSLAVFRII